MVVNGYTLRQWRTYANKLDEFASGNTIGEARNIEQGTCRYCAYSEPELGLPAYDMFKVLKGMTPIARKMSALYYNLQWGRIPVRIRLAADLAAFIRKEILHA